jgi:hypothetical protein
LDKLHDCVRADIAKTASHQDFILGG